ncbi:hypothetical protein UFOVP1604_125 [uncultured Caudovirales phage]|uniref:Uncharacterized protein n=1 Tax=uncultured Caudovirales phage TaxID=2100421 RepID=A0A6J5SU02_9CAUD|nr:hypothetical protein UFOVP1604_125 [uncultured Caudovirales phage]
MSENQNPITGFADTFLSKLKEQSFVIILMLGVIYYQHRLMEERVNYWQKLYEEKELYITEAAKDDKQILLDRIKYLQDQRDRFVDDALAEAQAK